MKIPRRFQLMGHEYRVHIVKPSEWKESDAVGMFDNGKRQILILKADLPTMQQVFLHEVEHVITLAMGRDDLYKDEQFIDLHASMYHQILTSMQ